MNNPFNRDVLEFIRDNGGKISFSTTTVEVSFSNNNNLFEYQPIDTISVGNLENNNPDCFVIDSITGRDKRSDRMLSL